MWVYESSNYGVGVVGWGEAFSRPRKLDTTTYYMHTVTLPYKSLSGTQLEEELSCQTVKAANFRYPSEARGLMEVTVKLLITCCIE